MTVFVALLRAVNVGGTGKLPMGELKRLGERAGFGSVRSYIASGNLLFWSATPESEVKAALEAELAAYAGKPIRVLVRTAAEMAEVAANNPFPNTAQNRTVAIFLPEPHPPDALSKATGPAGEELRLGAREFYVHYSDGMARSRLRIPAARDGTARNMNTVAELARLAAQHGPAGLSSA